MLGRNRRTARGSPSLDGLARVGILILVGVVPMLITVGLMIFVTRVVAPNSSGRTLVGDSSLASSPKPHRQLAVLNPDGRWSISASSTLRLAFRVRNVEASAHTYRWTVTTHAPGRASMIAASGRLRLADGASQAVRLRIPVACSASRSRVDVSLGGAHQTIGVWLPCPSKRAVPTAPSTVLAFINPTKPGTQQPDATLQFAFRVANHTPSSQSYGWTAETQTPGRATADAAIGHFTLPSYYFAVVPVHVRVSCMGKRSRISVSLGTGSPDGANQTIGFWLPCRSKRA